MMARLSCLLLSLIALKFLGKCVANTSVRSPNNPEAVAIKRIVGLEGDTVHTRPPYPFPEVKIPKGHIWVEGDGRPGTTIDSNTYGPVSRRLLVGRVTHILYPFHKFGEVKWWEHIPRPIERGPR